MGLSNFPVQLTSFIGREEEITNTKRLLFNSRLVTLTGAGGSGKTRLAIQIANEVSGAFADGVWFVDLAPLHEPALVTTAVARAFRLLPAADQPLMEMLLGFTRSKQLLLILDNCEHLTDACAQLAQELLFQAPDLRILATSREPLAIAGETIYPVSGLSWPSTHEGVDGNPDDLVRFDAVRLFVDRARSISPDFNLTSKNTASTVEICRRLDGLPLALELASARVNVLTVQEIAARLNDRFALLISGQRRGLEPRHHTLRAAIDWSYDLLAPGEQKLLRLMAVFEAGSTLDMLESICSGEMPPEESILHLITSLVSKSLVVAETAGRTQVRFRLLETIREYLLEKLDQAGEAELWHDRHLTLFLARAEQAAQQMFGAYQPLWLNWLEGEQDNLRAALAWSLEKRSEGSIEAGLRIAISLILFWQIRGNAQEGLAWYEQLLANADERISLAVRVNAIVTASFIAMYLGKGQASLEYGRKAVRIAEAVGDEGKPILALALGGLASGAKASGDYLTAFSVGERSVKLYREIGPSSYLGFALISQGEIAFMMGNYPAARELWNESSVLAQQNNNAYQLAHSLIFLGDLARLGPNYPEAAILYEKSVRLLRELNAQKDIAGAICNLGFTYLHQGELLRAHAFFCESIAIHQDKQNNLEMIGSLIGLAAIAATLGMPAEGERLLASVVSISGMPKGSRSPVTQMEFEGCQNLLRDQLTDTEVETEQALGSAMTLEQAVDYALNLPFPSGMIVPGIQAHDGLTGREREVAMLIAQGMANGEIAAELVLSKRTVETHINKILSKLGLTNRSQLISWAKDHGLTRPSE